MDFLQSIVLPQSAEHIELIRGLVIVAFIILMPYLAFVTGSVFYSLLYAGKGRKQNHLLSLLLAKDLSGMVTSGKGVLLALILIPMLGIIFGYAQLLSGSGSLAAEYMILALLFYVAGIVGVCAYKNTFNLIEEGKEIQLGKNRIFVSIGWLGFLFFLIGTYITISSIHLAIDKIYWGQPDQISAVSFAPDTIIDFFLFLTFALAVSPVMLLYVYFRPNTSKTGNAEHLTYIKNFALKTSLIFTSVLPVYLLLAVISLPDYALNNASFFTVLVSLVLLIFAVSYIYVMRRDASGTYSPHTVFLFILIFALVILKDQYAMGTTTKEHAKVLAAQYEEYQLKIKKELGIAVEKKIDGEAIYNTICSACHSFDKKIVGPPYNETLVKYEGKMDDLVDFILNPRKVNPDYPAMPNQGLKPAQAKAVAEFLMSHYNKNK